MGNEDKSHMNRTYRKFASWVGIVTIVIAQLALSAYACPMLLPNVGDRNESASVSSPISDYAHLVSPNLCHEHCTDEQQNINDAPQVQAVVEHARVFSATPVMSATTMIPATKLIDSLQHGPAPPLTIQHCCFRI